MTSVFITTDDTVTPGEISVGVPIPVGAGEANTILDAGQNTHESLIATPAKIDAALQAKGIRAGSTVVLTDVPADNVVEIATVVAAQQVSAVNTFLTASPTDVLIEGMTITPGAGTYIVLYSGNMHGSTGAKLCWFSVYANGVKQDHSERSQDGAASAQHMSSSTQALVTVADGQAIEIRGRGDGILEVNTRSLILLRVA